jgi:Zn-dependent metalloprotease
MKPICNCIFCITPPHILESIVSNGTPKQKEKATEILKHALQMYASRESLIDKKVSVEQAAAGIISRKVFDAGFGQNLPGTLVRSEGDGPTGDPATDEAYDGAGHTYNLYSDIYNRNSIDDLGMVINSTVHYGKGYDNAFWNGDQMVYGDGDEDLPVNERLFNRFTIALDIVGHELTHGVTQFEAKLKYSGQSGALNESYSDVFGSLVKQRTLNQTATAADWLIGQGLFTSNVNGVALRSMKDPGTAYNDPVIGKDPQPGHMKDYKNTMADNGGVHINSGIPNKAFYICATQIGGFAWEKAGKIWYITLRDKLSKRSDFQEAADKTSEVAGELFGTRSAEQNAVNFAWAEVGITVGASSKRGCFGFAARLFK